MTNNYCHTDINPLCPAHTNQPWYGVLPPTCICKKLTMADIQGMIDPFVEIDKARSLKLPVQPDTRDMQINAQAELIKSMRDEISVMQKRLDHMHRMHEDHYANHQTNKENMQIIVNDQDRQCVQIDKLTNELAERIDEKDDLVVATSNAVAAMDKRIDSLEKELENAAYQTKAGWCLLDLRIQKLEQDRLVDIVGRIENLELFNTQRMNEIAGSERELAKWVGEHGRRIKKLEQKPNDDLHNEALSYSNELAERVNKLADAIASLGQVTNANLAELDRKIETNLLTRVRNLESTQKCNPELDGAINADELHQAIQNLSDAFVVFKKGRE